MTNIANSPLPNITTTSGASISRLQMEALIGGVTNSLVFNECNFEGADFSRLNMSGCAFKGCNLIETSLYAANLSLTTWLSWSLRNAHLEWARFDSADLREADIGGLKLHDAKLFRGATISRNPAFGLLGELGLTVA